MESNNIVLVNEKNPFDTFEIDLLCAFELEESKYVIYSKNEKEYEGNNIVYSGKIELKNDKQYIKNVTKEEYDKIKDIIKKMVSYNGE